MPLTLKTDADQFSDGVAVSLKVLMPMANRRSLKSQRTSMHGRVTSPIHPIGCSQSRLNISADRNMKSLESKPDKPSHPSRCLSGVVQKPASTADDTKHKEVDIEHMMNDLKEE